MHLDSEPATTRRTDAIAKRYVITGPQGSGKTPILRELEASGFGVMPEPARAILAEQRASGGRGTGEQDFVLFNELMLARAISDHANATGTTFFDRAIPDHIVYYEVFGLDSSSARRAAEAHRYDLVFFTPGWPEIYTTDDERTMTYEMAYDFGERLRAAYEGLGYPLVEIPKGSPQERARFVTLNM